MMTSSNDPGLVSQDRQMLSVREAKQRVMENCITGNPARLHISETRDIVLAEDIFSPLNIPSWPQSSMDGYAFAFGDWQEGRNLKITGEVAAGSEISAELAEGSAVRIFTGAAVPAGADTVVMQEKTRIENGYLIISDDVLQPGSNVRPEGAEIRKGGLALKKGTILRPAALGFLTSMGITHVMAFPMPVTAIIVTGNELQQPGVPLAFGQVYESNSWSLKAALEQMHIGNTIVYHAEDTLEKVTTQLGEALQNADVIFLTGGVSVGDYDFVAGAAAKNSVRQIFHKIKQRPGKPLYFGKKENKLIFGLPGNPASALSCFYEYAEPALKKFAGLDSGVKKIQAPVLNDYKKAAGLTHFLKGHFDGNSVSLLAGQESYRLSSFAMANCLVQIEEDGTKCNAGDIVEVHLLP